MRGRWDSKWNLGDELIIGMTLHWIIQSSIALKHKSDIVLASLFELFICFEIKRYLCFVK